MLWSEILSKYASSDKRMTPEDAVILYRDAPLHSVRRAANEKRKQINGDTEVTYLCISIDLFTFFICSTSDRM